MDYLKVIKNVFVYQVYFKHLHFKYIIYIYCIFIIDTFKLGAFLCLAWTRSDSIHKKLLNRQLFWNI